MDLAIKNNDYPKEIVAHYNHAVIYRNMGKYNLSLPHIEKYLEYRRSINDTLGIGHGTYQLALLQRLRGDYDESLAAYKESIEMYRQAENSIGLAMAINGQGMLLCTIASLRHLNPQTFFVTSVLALNHALP